MPASRASPVGMMWPPTHSAPLRVWMSLAPASLCVQVRCSGCSGSSTGRKLELGFLAPLATSAVRPWWRGNTSRIRLDSLQSERCRTKAGSLEKRREVATSALQARIEQAGLLVAERAHARLVVGPARAHLDPQLQEDLGIEELFH